MKKLFIFFFFLLIGSTSFAQSITAPDPITIEANATNVDAGNFVITWGDNTSSILVSVSLDYHSGATISFPTRTGLALNTGYASWSGITSIVFYGTRDNINNALAAMTVSMGSIKTAIRINIEISSYDASYVYNPINKHFYKYVSSATITYANAKSGASGNSFKGKTGYLVTITSQSEQDFINNNISGSNIWIAITDAATTTDGTWILDAGPELGTIIKTQNGPTAGNISGQYNNWCSGEPNGANHTEDYAVAKWNGGTCWNDLSATNTSGVSGYIVEISADFPAGSDYTGVYAAYVVHNNDAAYTLGSGNTNMKGTWSNTNGMINAIKVNNGHTVTVPTSNTLYSNSINLTGTGKILFSDNSSKWYPTPILKSCKDIKTYFPLSISGVYTIDLDGEGSLPSTSCYCDMDTDGGGWTLVLNYLHKGGTDPLLKTFSSSLPLLGSTSLGTDESSSATNWGHVTPAYLKSFAFTELRFFGSTSIHSRIIHFKTSHVNTINYFKNGTGSMSGINTSYTLFSDHSAFLPNSARDYFTNEGNLAMTNFPFWLSGTYHWGIKGHNYRWEVDDFNNSSSHNTHHQIWIR